ncbi:MAG: galactose-1-phosphate uridylyltransferase [Thermoplasmata archaeon]
MSEYRKDPLTGRWRIIADGRSARPTEYPAVAPGADSDPDCPFCEGHETRTPPESAAIRPTGGRANGPGWTVRAFANKFPSVEPSPSAPSVASTGSFERLPGAGVHEVVVLTARHSSCLAELTSPERQVVFRFLRDRVRTIAHDPSARAVLLFENRGPESGGTLRHPHVQIVATGPVPPRLAEESRAMRERVSGACRLEPIVGAEVAARDRILAEDAHFVAFAPYASEHPYEVWIVPRRHRATYADATDAEVDRLSELLPALLAALAAVRPGASYNWFVHGLSTSAGDGDGFHWHVEVAPRLVRADGFEVGGGLPVNPVPPESAAVELRAHLGPTPSPAARKR